MLQLPNLILTTPLPILHPMFPMLRIIHAHNIRALLHMIHAAKQRIHVLQRHLPCLRNPQPDKHRQSKVDASKKEKGVETAFGEEAREELLEDGVDDVLSLRGHADGLGADVEGEDFGGPDPDCGAPGWFVEELEGETGLARVRG